MNKCVKYLPVFKYNTYLCLISTCHVKYLHITKCLVGDYKK